MALAYLFHQIVQERRVPDLEVSALIIDHGARKESKDEAHKVAGWMKEFGIYTLHGRILPGVVLMVFSRVQA